MTVSNSQANESRPNVFFVRMTLDAHISNAVEISKYRFTCRLSRYRYHHTAVPVELWSHHEEQRGSFQHRSPIFKR